VCCIHDDDDHVICSGANERDVLLQKKVLVLSSCFLCVCGSDVNVM